MAWNELRGRTLDPRTNGDGIPSSGILTKGFFDLIKENLMESGASRVLALGDIIYGSGSHEMGGRLSIASGEFGNYVVAGAASDLQWSTGVGNLSWRNYVTSRTVFLNAVSPSSVIAKAAGIEFLEAQARNTSTKLLVVAVDRIGQSELDYLLSSWLEDSDSVRVFRPHVRHYSLGTMQGSVLLGTDTSGFSISGTPMTWDFGEGGIREDLRPIHRIGFTAVGTVTGEPIFHVLDVKHGMRVPDFEPLAPPTVSDVQLAGGTVTGKSADYRIPSNWFIRSSDFESLTGDFSFEGYTSAGTLDTVTGVGLTGNVSSIGVTWNDVPEANEYHVQWRTREGSFTDTSLSRTVSDTSFVITGLAADTLYYVRVRALGMFYVDGRWSDEESISTETPTLGRVDGLAISSIARTSARATWTAVAGATSYDVEVGTSSGGSNIVSTSVSGTGYTITGLTGGTRYYVRVKAKASGYNDGLWSGDRSFVTLVPQLDAPTGVAATAQSSTSIRVTWRGVTNATGYIVSWEDNVTGTIRQSTRGSSSRSYTITGLVSNRGYTIGVQAVSSSSDYSDSDWVYVVESTDQSTLGQVGGVSVSDITTNSATVSWGAVTDADEYDYQWRSSSQSYTSSRRRSTSSRSTSLISLSSGTTYYVQVRATASGFTDGPWSTEVNFTVGRPTLGKVTGVSLHVGHVGRTPELRVSFNGVTSATDYEAEVYTNSRLTARVNTVTGLSSGEGVFFNPSSGTTYYVRVRATASGFTDGPWSDTASITYTAPGLAQVTGVGLFIGSVGRTPELRVSFNGVTSATGYEAEVYTDSSLSTRVNTVTGLSSGEGVFFNPSSGTTYYVRVRATASGFTDGPWSDTASITYTAPATSPGTGRISPPNLSIQGSFFAYTIDDTVNEVIVPPQPYRFEVSRSGASARISWSLEPDTSMSNITYHIRYRNAYVDNEVGSRAWQDVEGITGTSHTLDPSSVMVHLLGDTTGSTYDLGWWLEVQVRAVHTPTDGIPVGMEEYYTSLWTPSYYINMAR